MPQYGARDIAPMRAHAPLASALAREEVVLPKVEVLHVMFEIDDAPMLDLLPRALHPAIPPSVTYVIWRAPESPAGPFTLAQVRLSCRAAIRPRGFVIDAYCDSTEAIAYLAERWGYSCVPADVSIRRNYDRITGSVVAEQHGMTVSLVDPQSISGGDVAYTPNLNLARVPIEGGEAVRLVQVDPDYTFHKAERGRPLVERFDLDPARTANVRPVYPVAATMCVCDITMPVVRYLTDPEVPAMNGTTTISA